MIGGGWFVVMGGRIKGEGGNVFVRVAQRAGRGFFPEAEGVEFGSGVDARIGVKRGLSSLQRSDEGDRQRQREQDTCGTTE